MPAVNFTNAELEALYALHTAAERVNWPAYARARQRIVDAGTEYMKFRAQDVVTRQPSRRVGRRQSPP